MLGVLVKPAKVHVEPQHATVETLFPKYRYEYTIFRKDTASSGSPQIALLVEIELGVNAVDVGPILYTNDINSQLWRDSPKQ